MIRAYEETYLNDAMNNLGDMFDYAICDLGYEPEIFFSQFLISGIAKYFEKGNPKYIAGLSGIELADEVIYRTEGKRPCAEPSEEINKSPEYWSGWILAYYQWYTAHSFSYIHKRGLNISRILSLYPTLHEADLSKFVSVADGIIEKSKNNDVSNLKKIRQAKGVTQKELSELTGVSLRMIQLYEQKQQNIRKAEAQTLVNISKSLGCDVETLFE
ncbi:MAG: helix-turn-helix transcriptional regulator [Clostridiales bacterium]|nr:helix-turn-helix transcriptional regulator [Clostridiales bacterium]